MHDPERLLRLLANPQRPVQLVLAGKAHPADQAGQTIIRQWMQFIQRPEVRRHVIFFSDYNMLLSENLVQGATYGSIRTAGRVAVSVVRTDEELTIARCVCRVLGLDVNA